MDDFDPEQKHVMSVLEPYLDQVYRIFPEAIKTYNSIDSRITADHEDRTAAGCVRDHAWMSFQSNFEGTPGFHFLEVRGMQVLNIKDQVVLRVKKVDANGNHRNYPTQQQIDFDNQVDLAGLPPAATRVIIGYQPDAAFSEVQRVIVRRPKGLWASQIVDIDETVAWVDISQKQLPFGSTGRAVKR